jgi:hypothetical protein
VFETGTMSVAEQDGRVLAFAGAITRGPVTFLTDLFVHPQTQSRAQALYTREGMQPLFPHFNLQWQGPVHTEPEPLVSEARRHARLRLCATGGSNLAHSSDLGGRPGGGERASIRDGVRSGGYKMGRASR